MGRDLKKKILWCDQSNIHELSSILLMDLQDIEVESVNNPLKAIEILKQDNTYSLIISGALFWDVEGIDIFHYLQFAGLKIQFLLFTASPKDQKIESLIHHKNFTYLSKHDFKIDKFISLIEELSHKDASNDEIHLKVKAIRSHLGMSTSQFAQYLNVEEKVVVASEASLDTISWSYVVCVCEKIGISLSFIAHTPLHLFVKRLEEQASNPDVKRAIV